MPYKLPRTPKIERYSPYLDGKKDNGTPGDLTRHAARLLRSTCGEFRHLPYEDRVRRFGILRRWHLYNQECRAELLGRTKAQEPFAAFAPGQEYQDLRFATYLRALIAVV